MSTKLTLSQAKAAVKALSGTLVKTVYGDYRLRLHGEEYFTDSLEDAVLTAIAINGNFRSKA